MKRLFPMSWLLRMKNNYDTEFSQLLLLPFCGKMIAASRSG
jgi:hypothetical protein